MSLVDYLNQVFTVLSHYVSFLFNLIISPGVSIGSIFLVGSLLFVIVTNLWPRA